MGYGEVEPAIHGTRGLAVALVFAPFTGVSAGETNANVAVGGADCGCAADALLARSHFADVGTEPSKNGRRLAVVGGSDFAAAYFSTWLGDDAIDTGFRDALRNGLSERARN